MQRVKHKGNKIIPYNLKLHQDYLSNNNIPNGNNNKTIEPNSEINKINILNRSNKFLSIPERQKIIHEINDLNNQLNLYRPPENLESSQNKRTEDSKKLLYIKKTKSNLNLAENKNYKSGTKNLKNTNNKMEYNTHIKFTENNNFINKTIKEYYPKKNENPFKNYLKTLNNELGEDQTKKYKKGYYINPNFFTSNTTNQNKSRNYLQNYNNTEENINTPNEIYKKPISTKAYNKPNTKNIKENDIQNKNKNSISKNISTNKLYINNNVKEKINYAKMMNNNGVKRSIFNMINNYNTKTIKNYKTKDNSKKVSNNKKKQNNSKEFLIKNNSMIFKLKNNNAISNNINLNEIYNKDYFVKKNNILNHKNIISHNIKKKSYKNNKSLNYFKPAYINNEFNNKLIMNDFCDLNKKESNINNYKQKTFYGNNLKYIKKNIPSPGPGAMPKKRIIKSNFMSNDLPRILVEKDIISLASLTQKSNLNVQNNGKLKHYNIAQFANNNEIISINNNYFSEREYIPKKVNDKFIKNSYINTEIKRSSKNKSLTLSLDQSSKNENKRNKSFSYRDDETSDNCIYQNGKNKYKYQNGKSISPSFRENNYAKKPKNSLITKEVYFPFSINKNNSFYYNSDDDIMNSNNNSNIGSYNDSYNRISGINYNNSFENSRNYHFFNNNNYNSYNKNKNNILNLNQSPSPTKDYYFNYLSNKINNDILNEKNFNRLDKNLYNSDFFNQRSFCLNCKRNYCPYCCRLSPSNEFGTNSNNIINKKITPLKYIGNNYLPSTIHSRTISMNFESNNLKNNLIRNNKERYEEEEENAIIKKPLNARNVDLKLDVSNGKHSSENLNQNINNNNNALDGGSFNSIKIEAIENEINKDKKNLEIYKYDPDQSTNKEEEKNKKLDLNLNINDIKDKEINIENEIKYKKDSEIDKNEQIKSLSEITSSERFIIKGEGISLSNSEFLLNDNNNENTNKKNSKINDLSKDNEDKENKPYKKIKEDIQNIPVTPPTKRNSFIKDNSINNNENNFTKTDIDCNINNTNTGIIIKNLSIKEDLAKKSYINIRFQSESPILCDILEYINIISLKNYFKIKDKISNIITNNDENISKLFVSILYPIAIKQKKYQPIYAKLCKDIDKNHNKKDKTKSVIRTQIMKFCKSNFKKIKVYLENIIYIENDINFIGELINAQMVSKKVGQQCLNHLVNKFNQYNCNSKLSTKKTEKYLYLDSIINLVNQFGTCINCYQKNKIRPEDLLKFQEDINNNIELLKEISKNKKNEDMPVKTKIELLKLIKKSERNWEFTLLEKTKNQLLKFIFEEKKNDNYNNFKTNKNINTSNFNFKNNNINSNKNNHKQIKSASPSNKNIIIEKKNNISNEKKSRLNSSQKNNNVNNLEKIIEYSKIFRDNLILFKRHIDENKSSDNFKNWEEIDNLFLNKKIQKFEIFKSIIEASKYFIENKNDIYYFDIYIKVIIEYYYKYFKKNEISKIANSVLEDLSQLSNEEIKKEENQFLNDIWIVMLYYLLENKIMSLADFDYFCKGYNNEIQNNILNILNGVCCYRVDKKDIYLKELKITKIYEMKK